MYYMKQYGDVSDFIDSCVDALQPTVAFSHSATCGLDDGH